MRFLILFTVLFSFFLVPAQAQRANENPNLVIGAQAGVSVSRTSSREEFQFKQYSVVRPVFGVYADIGSAHSLSLRTGLSYLMLGNQARYNDGRFITRLNYFAIPLLAKYKFEGGEFGLFAGPQLSFLTDAKIKDTRKEFKDIKDESGKTDIAGLLGVTIEPKRSPVNFSLTWHVGFKKVYTERSGDDLYHRGATLAMQYRIFQH